MEVDIVPWSVFPSEMAEGHHGTAATVGYARGGGDGPRRYSEKWGKNDAFAAVVLIRGVPDDTVVFELFEQAAQVPAVQCHPITTLPCAGHHRVHQWVVMVALHHVGLNVFGDQGAPQIKGAVVTAQQQDALASGKGSVDMFKAVDFCNGHEAGGTAEPGQPNLHDTDAVGAERRLHQCLLFRFG